MNLGEVMRMALENQALEMHTALPGIVRSYDASSQTAEIELAVRRNLPAVDEDEEEDTFETLPILPSVPVVFPRAGGFYLHFPLSEGDSVLVVFSESDMNAWRNSGDVSDPIVGHRHGIGGGVAIPGLHPRTNPNPDASASSGTIGTEGGVAIELRSGSVAVGGDSDAAAKASEVDQQLNDLKSAINGWTPVPNDGGAALKAALTAWLADTAASSSSVLKVGS